MNQRPRKIALLGSTGSIGRSTIDVVGSSQGSLQILALSGHRHLSELCQQAQRLLPRFVVATDEAAASRFDWSALPRETQLLTGQSGLERIVRLPEVDVVLSAVVGSAGLRGTWAALERRQDGRTGEQRNAGHGRAAGDAAGRRARRQDPAGR